MEANEIEGRRFSGLRFHMFFALLLVAGLLTGCGDDSDTEGKWGWAVGLPADGYGTILHTDDGGKSWTRQGSSGDMPNTSMEDIAAINRHIAWAVGGVSQGEDGVSYGTILRTVDGGKKWIRQGSSVPLANTGLLGIAALDSETAWTVGQFGLILKTVDGGMSWARQAPFLFPNVEFQMVSAADDRNVWAVGVENGNNGVILHSSDGGETWKREAGDLATNIAAVIDVHAVDDKVVWAAGTDHSVFKTTDGGKHWVSKRPQGAPLLHVNGIVAFDAKRAWIAVDNYQIYHTIDGGDSWNLWTVAPPDSAGANVFAAYMGVTATDDTRVWVIGFTFDGQGLIAQTFDTGKNWEAQVPASGGGLRWVSFVGAAR